LILGALITTVFTAANIYLGLKVGLTFASSIPAAVISMAILSVVKDSSIRLRCGDSDKAFRVTSSATDLQMGVGPNGGCSMCPRPVM
jgi:hypothetical protein